MNENEIKLLELLKQKNPQTATELSCQLNVSNRTVYRWAEKLAERGLKIVTTKGRNGGIFLEDVNIDLSSLDSKTCQNSTNNKTRSKTKIIISDSWLEISFSKQEKDDNIDKKYDICKKAIFEKKVISFTYSLPEGKILNCTTEPVRLYLSDNQWHILAWIRKAEKFKLFKLKNISNLELHNESFDRQADFIIQDVLN